MDESKLKKLNGVAQQLSALRKALSAEIVGQEELLDMLILALLTEGHILLEGPPGVAKTTAIKTLASFVDASFHRVQFTPDLLPADLTGGEIYRSDTHTFEFREGPLFHDLVLADEINRAPAKVQSALLEAMEERQITVGHKSYPLSPVFTVLATQNPIEQEGTYALPEAQLDRFLAKVRVSYAPPEEEHRILQKAMERRFKARGGAELSSIVRTDFILKARRACLAVSMVEAVERYIVALVCATRAENQTWSEWIMHGASPRGTISLTLAAKGKALLEGRDFVTPEDVAAVCLPVLRHRIILSLEAEIAGMLADDVLYTILEKTPTA